MEKVVNGFSLLILLVGLSGCSTWPDLQPGRDLASPHLSDFQGDELPTGRDEAWRCGAPLTYSVFKKNRDGLLKDNRGLKDSLRKVSKRNLKALIASVPDLSEDEKRLLEKVGKEMPAPIIHRTSVGAMESILTGPKKLVSAAKRKVKAARTPGIEDNLFSGFDCIFTSVVPPKGIEKYGPVLVRFKNQRNFSWGSMYTGFHWYKEKVGGGRDKIRNAGPVTYEEKRGFAEQIYTNNDWPEVIGFQILKSIREGKGLRGKGRRFKKHKILGRLLDEDDARRFWKTIADHRLGFLEGHYTDNISLDELEYIEFPSSSRSAVKALDLPKAWFDSGFLRFR